MHDVNPKVAAAGVAGAATVLVVWLLESVGVDVPPEAASAFTTLFAFGAGFIKSA
jgi:hypothetical protein